jgi:type II secretory ATPase GspE/PulE/Tfp pilus assembly ATPase PilB-like protein
VASSLQLVVAQRLIRRLCPKCKEPAEMPDNIVKQYSLSKRDIFQAKGCEYCRNTGYSGRVAVHEFLLINQEIRQLITDREDISKIQDAGRKTGMKTLTEDGIEKVIEGTTSIEEVISAVFK